MRRLLIILYITVLGLGLTQAPGQCGYIYGQALRPLTQVTRQTIATTPRHLAVPAITHQATALRIAIPKLTLHPGQPPLPQLTPSLTPRLYIYPDLPAWQPLLLHQPLPTPLQAVPASPAEAISPEQGLERLRQKLQLLKGRIRPEEIRNDITIIACLPIHPPLFPIDHVA